MPIPATTGQLRTSVYDMKIGDYIPCHYQASSGNVGTFSQLGTATGEEIPVTGASAPNGLFYWIKTKTGVLIADRIVQHSISWDELNSSKVIQGLPWAEGDTNGFIRSLTGGVAYIDEFGNKLIEVSQNGTWPVNNEFDEYITRFPQELIQEGKTAADVFNTTGMFTWCQDTPADGIQAAQGGVLADNICRTARSLPSNGPVTYGFGVPRSSLVTTIHGFRPVFEYREE